MADQADGTGTGGVLGGEALSERFKKVLQGQVDSVVANDGGAVVCTDRMYGGELGSTLPGLYMPLLQRFGLRCELAHGELGELTLTVATALKSALEERRLRLPFADQRVRDELLKLKGKYTATGRFAFHAASDGSGHADHFWALALGVAGASAATPPLELLMAGQRQFAAELQFAMMEDVL